MELFVLEPATPARRRGGDLRNPPRKRSAGVPRSLRARRRVIAAAALLGVISIAAPARAADVDLTAGVLSHTTLGANQVANALTISLAGGTYTIDDPADTAITLTGNALGQGCAPFDSNTVTCPAAAITSFNIATSLGNDTIVLTGAAHPAVVNGGDGNDTFIGGPAGETFVWNPGDDDDTVDGGPGDDTVLFNGANAAEVFNITADGAGFVLLRNIANVRMEVENAETLELRTFGGADSVVTTGLVDTAQVLVDGLFGGGDDGAADVLTLDAAGLCPFFESDVIEVVGRQPVQFSGFPNLAVTNEVCGAILDLTAGGLTFIDPPGSSVANALDISLAGATYTIHDAGGVVSPAPRAVDQGCQPVAPNTVTCPAAAITSFDVSAGFGDDAVVLAGAAHPAIVRGGPGSDTIIGGSADDTFHWFPGDGSDVVDGGPGNDTLAFFGSNGNEIVTITADGAGFDLTRNLGTIQMEVENAEVLELMTLGGDDEVSTTSLLNTTQFLTGDTDALPDALRVDAGGLCLTRQGDTFEAEGRQTIHFFDFPEVFVSNVFCPPDPCDGAVPTQGCKVNGVRDQPCLGTPGDDVIVGTTAGDVILGGGGRDRIKAGSGDDLVCGEEGDDTLVGASGNDTLSGGPGVDLLKDSGGTDTLLGGAGADDLKGGSDTDDLDGGPGDDRLRGGGDPDTLRGGPGVDRLDGGGDADTCTDADQVGPFLRCELPSPTTSTTTTSTTTTSTSSTTSSTIFF